MATQTTNIRLTKPAASENINLTDINANWDAIDAAFGALGTISASNNVKNLITNESTSAKLKSTASSTWDATASGITALPALLTADVKAEIAAYANAVDSLAGDSSVANNSVTMHAVSTTYTVPSTSTQTTVYAAVVLYKRASGAYYCAQVIPWSINIPFYMKRNNTTRQIRVIV